MPQPHRVQQAAEGAAGDHAMIRGARKTIIEAARSGRSCLQEASMARTEIQRTRYDGNLSVGKRENYLKFLEIKNLLGLESLACYRQIK